MKKNWVLFQMQGKSDNIRRKSFIDILSNPLLFYTDKAGKSVFRSFCFLADTGCSYDTAFPKANVGKALEYRFQLDKIFKRTVILTSVILYFIFIHINPTIWRLLFFELLWLGIVCGTRIYLSALYSEYLIHNFGKYILCDFEPPVPKHKTDEYVSLFKSKAAVLAVVLCLYFLPALFLQFAIKMSLSPKHLHCKRALAMSNLYTALYPKSEHIYDMRAFSKFMEKDFEGALNDYKTVIVMSGRKFKQKDSLRFANLLLLQKKIGTTREALNLFDEYLAKKKMSVLYKSQMLWIKSIFKIENHITDDIVQDYENLLALLDEDDYKNQFYISSDLAYVLYLMQEYSLAVNNYNSLITFAGDNKDVFAKELKAAYAERGWAKRNLGDEAGAIQDFTASGIPFDELKKYEPSYETQKFVVEHF